MQSRRNITILGGGAVAPGDLSEALRLAPELVAADGGADTALAQGLIPRKVIGDFDSISEATRAAIPPDRLCPIAEQDSTDFEKCLRSVSAPLILGLGVLGARLDHQMAALNALARFPAKRIVLLGERDICFLCPPRLGLDLPEGTRLSLFPLAPASGNSTGLRWPIDGLVFAPDGRVGTSNITVAPRVEMVVTAAAMLVILPRAALAAAVAGLMAAEPAHG
ncbi:thiamine pyrophosphokinase [Rhodovulum imhoffii]|uniref:Thiamine diphosphokinase n=1 Tax=Rhodovulum imhoffii TaxID=365340 RepID=A0A2T5BQR3_9RHOB|nr:thiamine diphosphokinase [Rhodovulum imhoffii]MBK5933875.1 thiamine diphosphokinase [Rhodovulum imhoffii]PTN01537.1 thiamine pyrophosphokinase [Rhodovulum imhoffii]